MAFLKEYISFLVEKELSKLGTKNKAVNIPTNSETGKLISPDVADMVKKTYANIGGFKGSDNPDGLLKKYTDYFVSDIDEDPEPDTAIVYTNWNNSQKASVIATDGSPEAKAEIRKMMKTMFSRPNTWIEVSGASAAIMIKKMGLKTVDDEKLVRKLLHRHPDLVWHGKHPQGVPYGNGWYTREIGGKPQIKIIVGNPPKTV